jgi:lipopolysaccharide export system permease protein
VGVLAVLVGLDALSSVIDELDDLSPDYSFTDALIYVVFTLPRRLHEYVPFAALIGALVGLGRLAATSELTVVRAAGRSLPQLALATLRPALVLAVLGFLVGEFVSPVAEQYAVSHKALAQGSQSSFTGRGGQWLLEKVSRTELTQDRAVTDALIQQVWKTEVTPQLLALEAVALDSLPTLQLWPYAQYLRKQGLMYRDVELAFWRKVLQPLAVAGLVLVAMSFIFGPLREGSLGARIFTGVIIGVVFRISQDFFGPASLIFGLPAILAAAAPIGICWIAGGWLLTRDN